MEVSSNFSKGFTDEDEEEDEFGKRDTPAAAADLTVRMDGKTNIDQKPTTPRTKHSVTEQRRRSKINDRFQVLRDLIPHSDQKRDKASFLLEVIEYIQFLQEKVQSYESTYPRWSQENPNLMPWVKVLFRSFWEKAQKKYQAPAEGLTDYSQVIKNGSPHSSGFVFPVSERVTASQCILPNNQPSAEYENTSSELASKAVRAPDSLQQHESSSGSPHRQALISDLLHATSLSPSSAACHEIHADENLLNDDNNVSISSVYSQSLLQVLTQSLHSSGVDISQANISVQIILGKSPWNRTICSQKGYRDLPVDNCCTEPEQLQKRHKSDVNPP